MPILNPLNVIQLAGIQTPQREHILPSPTHNQWDRYIFRPAVPMHLRTWAPRITTPPSAPVLRIVSYNLLAESLEALTTQGLDPQISSFDARKWLLAHELESWAADVYCLQEVEHYTYLQALLCLYI